MLPLVYPVDWVLLTIAAKQSDGHRDCGSALGVFHKATEKFIVIETKKESGLVFFMVFFSSSNFIRIYKKKF